MTVAIIPFHLKNIPWILNSFERKFHIVRGTFRISRLTDLDLRTITLNFYFSFYEELLTFFTDDAKYSDYIFSI